MLVCKSFEIAPKHTEVVEAPPGTGFKRFEVVFSGSASGAGTLILSLYDMSTHGFMAKNTRFMAAGDKVYIDLSSLTEKSIPKICLCGDYIKEGYSVLTHLTVYEYGSNPDDTFFMEE